MATIIIDGVSHTVPDGQNLLHVVLSLGYDLPYFCWHPALGSVGACRQCAVVQYKDEKDTRGRIVMACMTPATDGTRISIGAPDAREFRKSVIEWLMVNHPHDCPVCDEGGECHLQDMTMMTGHNYREYRFSKRTYQNQDLGPFINHEMNRCIACYRCVRYYRDYAGGEDLNVFAVHDHVYFGRFTDGTLESPFSGNLVEVCPTGVFTDKTLGRHYTRKWDLQSAPSVCHHCSVGCNTIGGERYNMLRRIIARYNQQVNGYFLCDRGRFGYEFVNSDRRIRRPMVRQTGGGAWTEAGKEEALGFIGSRISGASVIGIGSPRASLESNYALRNLVGAGRFFSGMPAAEQRLVKRIQEILSGGTVPTASLHDIESAEAVVVLGEDILNVAPMMALAVRQATRNQPLAEASKVGIPRWNDAAARELIQDKRGPLVVITPAPTGLDSMATSVVRALPDDVAAIGTALAHSVAADAPAATGLSRQQEETVRTIAEALRGVSRVAVISGTSLLSEGILVAAANLASALQASGKEAMLAFSLAECNTMGVSLIEGEELEKAFDLAGREQGLVAIVLENDLFRRAPQDAVASFFDACAMVIAVDALHTATTERADVVLPAGTFAEGDGTLVNYEGRAQRFFQVMAPDLMVQEGWRWIQAIGSGGKQNGSAQWESLDDVIESLVASHPRLAAVRDAAPGADFSLHGRKVARQPYRYTGRTAMLANVTIHEPKPPDDPDGPFRFSMEGFRPIQESPLIPMFWSPGWNSQQSINKFQSEVGGPLVGGNPGVKLFVNAATRKTTYTPWSQTASPAKEAGAWTAIPLYEVFGSEELSSRGKAISQRAPAPYAALNAASAERFGGNGTIITVRLDGRTLRLPIRIMEGLPDGTVGLPVGIVLEATVAAPASCSVTGGEA